MIASAAPIWAFCLVLTGLAMTPAAQAFELLRSTNETCSADPHLRWSPARIEIDTADLDAGRRGLADEAVAAWRNVMGARLQFVTGDGEPCDRDDGVTTLAYRDDTCQLAPFANDVLAITVTYWVGNRIVDADVTFNPAVTLSNASFRQVAMHEIGHVLGLDHSNACGDPGNGTLMNSRLVESFDAPQEDDIAGARFIYGGGGGDVGVPSGANGCAVVEPAGGGAWALIAVGLLAFFGRYPTGRRLVKSSVDGSRDLF